MPQAIRTKGAFWYAVDSGDITANATVSPSIAIGADADFLCMRIGADATSYAFTLKITDEAQGTVLMNTAVHGRAICGQTVGSLAAQVPGGGPLPLDVPYRFKANNQMGLEITDLSSATNRVRIAFHGVKVPVGANITIRARGIMEGLSV
jgi:hypothetical protein